MFFKRKPPKPDAPAVEATSAPSPERSAPATPLVASPTPSPAGSPPAAHAVQEALDRSNLQQINAHLDVLKTRSAQSRRLGDETALSGGGAVRAHAQWREALTINEEAIGVAHSYTGLSSLFDANGKPVQGGNYPLTNQEARFAFHFSDLMGRQGGLLRRLGELGLAKDYYDRGAAIEANGSALAVVNSYCTVNAIAIRIEMGECSASPTSTGLPDLREKIAEARGMVLAQIETGGRRDDGWAYADLALAVMLSGYAEEMQSIVPRALDRYVQQAGVQDIETTARIIKNMVVKLAEISDPIGSTLAQGLQLLKGKAQAAGKLVQI